MIEAGLETESIAEILFSGLSQDEITDLARQYLIEQVDEKRRSHELGVRLRAAGVEPRFMNAKHGSGSTNTYKRGCRCQDCISWHEKTSEWDREHMERFGQDLVAGIAKYTLAIRAEWNEELLASTFGTPEGRVTWGEATVEQHRTHNGMLITQMTGVGRDVALHEKAMKEMELAGVECLNDLVQIDAEVS